MTEKTLLQIKFLEKSKYKPFSLKKENLQVLHLNLIILKI
jgi:hypothetical protein